jgi:hypothetical protein
LDARCDCHSFFFGEFSKLVADGRQGASATDPCPTASPSEAIADPIDGMVGRPNCYARLVPGGVLHL